MMSDYPFPKQGESWYELQVMEKAFPRGLRALEPIRDGLDGCLSALEAIAESQASHAQDAGAACIFVAIANAWDGVQPREEYDKFSQPFDRMILDAVSGAPLNTLHLHGDKVRLDLFVKGWPAASIKYSASGIGVGAGAMRKQYPAIPMAGFDEVNFRNFGPAALRRAWKQARAEAGGKFILALGCSVPNDNTPTELSRVPAMLEV